MNEVLADIIGLVHFAAALLALATGGAVLLLAKGTPRHRRFGAIYVVDMLALNVAALALHREDLFGPFHVLALLSLATIVGGFALIRWGHRSDERTATHAYLMSWSYVGLVAAGTGQAAVQFGLGSYVTWVILVTLIVGGLMVHLLTPTTIRNL